jgi:hypothetical protein
MPQLSDYLAKIPSQHRQQPKFLAMVSLFVQTFIDNQNLWAQIPAYFNLNTAAQYALPETNFVFDWIGKWVGVPRSGLSDADYAVILKLQIAVNHWDGTVPGIYAIWNVVFGSAVEVLVQDNQDMSMFVTFVTLPPSFNTAVRALLISGQFDLRRPGVKMLGHFEPSSAGHPVFGLDVENDSISGIGVGYFVEPVTP